MTRTKPIPTRTFKTWYEVTQHGSDAPRLDEATEGARERLVTEMARRPGTRFIQYREIVRTTPRRFGVDYDWNGQEEVQISRVWRAPQGVQNVQSVTLFVTLEAKFEAIEDEA